MANRTEIPVDLAAASLVEKRSTISSAGLLKISIIGLLIAVLYSRILADMAVDWWTDPSASQGLLIPPLALYVAWLLRRETFQSPATADSRGYLVSGAACVLLILGRLAAEFFLQRISFVVLLAGITLTFWGWRRLRTLSFPFLLLVTMVPFPALVSNTVALPLQLLASQMASEIARFFGVALFQDGNLIRLAGATLGVEEACSGLSALSALMVASLLIGFLLRQRPWIRMVLFALAVPIAIGVNIVRVAGSAVLADYNPALARGFYHSFSGWLVFLVGSLTLIAAAKAFQKVFSGESHR